MVDNSPETHRGVLPVVSNPQCGCISASFVADNTRTAISTLTTTEVLSDTLLVIPPRIVAKTLSTGVTDVGLWSGTSSHKTEVPLARQSRAVLGLRCWTHSKYDFLQCVSHEFQQCAVLRTAM